MSSQLPLLPPVEDLLHGLRVVAIPMRVRFRGITTREVALVQGPCGVGEFGPFVEYPPDEAAAWLDAAIESAYLGWPAARRDLVPVNATVPAVPADQVPQVLAHFGGCRTAKVKVAEPGQGLADDVDRVAAVREVLGPGAKVRIDANGAWSVPDALAALARLAAYDLEYAEQPCRTVDDLVTVRTALARNGINVRIAADGSVRKATDPLAVARRGAADLLVVKVAPLGGVRRALDLVAEAGLPAVVSSALDTSVGIAAGVALAAALPELDFACGLGTVSLLEGDIGAPTLRPAGGQLPVGAVAVDPQAVQRYAAAADRVQWWRDRVSNAHQVLTQRRTGRVR